MAKVGAQRAGELTGKSKSTIQRAMNAGKLSYEVDDNGRRVIDVSELERVFGLTNSGATGGRARAESQQDAADLVKAELERAQSMLEMERLRMRVRMLEDQLFVTNQQIEDVKGQRDEWQKQAQQVLITSQYSQKQAEDLKTQLAERDRRDEALRQKRLAERMQQMQSRNTNQNAGQKTPQQAPQGPRPATSNGQPVTQRPAQQGAQRPPQHPAAQSAKKTAKAIPAKRTFLEKLFGTK